MNKDRVAMIVGEGLADILDNEGLIRPDYYHGPAPTHWRVHVRLGASTPTYHGYGLRREFENVAHTGMNQTHHWQFRPASSAEVVFPREATAKTQMTRAHLAGLDAEITPMVLIPVTNYV